MPAKREVVILRGRRCGMPRTERPQQITIATSGFFSLKIFRGVWGAGPPACRSANGDPKQLAHAADHNRHFRFLADLRHRGVPNNPPHRLFEAVIIPERPRIGTPEKLAQILFQHIDQRRV